MKSWALFGLPAAALLSAYIQCVHMASTSPSTTTSAPLTDMLMHGPTGRYTLNLWSDTHLRIQSWADRNIAAAMSSTTRRKPTPTRPRTTWPLPRTTPNPSQSRSSSSA